MAGEIKSDAQIHMDVDPGSGTVRKTLNELVDIIDKELNTDPKTRVVIHCAMGMERSPLTVVWYLHKYHNKTLDEAYEITMAKRESTVDRRNWINM